MDNKFVKTIDLIKTSFDFDFNKFLETLSSLNKNDKKNKIRLEQNSNITLNYSSKLLDVAILSIDIIANLKEQEIFKLNCVYILNFVNKLELEDTINKKIVDELAPEIKKYISDIYKRTPLKDLISPPLINKK